LCTALCCAPLLASAQTSEKSTSPKRLYQEGQTLFQQKAYAAAISPLQAYVRQMNADGKKRNTCWYAPHTSSETPKA
jgi:outer membrane protein assembly factor BamD (BamD/ComL family)